MRGRKSHTIIKRKRNNHSINLDFRDQMQGLISKMIIKRKKYKLPTKLKSPISNARLKISTKIRQRQ